MTGTADTEAYEFQQIYGWKRSSFPTNKPICVRISNDQIFRTTPEKIQRDHRRHPRPP